MTAAEKAFVERLRRRAARMTPGLAKRELEAYRLIAAALNERELEAAIRSGQVDRLIMELLSDANLDPSLARLRAKIEQTVAESARAEAMRGLPSWLRPPAFGVFNPLVIEAAAGLNLKYVERLKEDVRATVRQAVTEGLREGVNPRTVARGIRGVIGLAPNQEEAVRNFERMLREGDLEALTRKLRDRRFDGTLRKAFAGDGLSAAQLETMTSAYRRRMVAFNAETHARTLALDAQKLAQRAAWDDAIARGVISPDQLVRVWVTVGDDRVRPEHVAMNGTRVGYYENFVLPDGTEQALPGDTEYNCRCQARVMLNYNRAEVAA